MQEEVREVIVIIDGSTDGTLEFLEDFCRTNDVVRYLDNNVNRGIPFSKNRGIDAAVYEYSFFGEDDLELTENFFKTLSSHMLKMNADVMCGRGIWRYDTESAEESVIRANELTGPYVNLKTIEIQSVLDVVEDREELILANPMLAKSALFREIRFDENYRGNFWREETDFQLSAREHHYKLACCPHALCYNFEITNDQGGVYALARLKRERWTITNTWLFVNKHERFIRDNFSTGNKYIYIVKFASMTTWKFVVAPLIMPRLSRAKQALIRMTRKAG